MFAYKLKLVRWLLPILSAGILNLAHALPEDRLKPVNIEADNAQLSNKTSETIYRGNVVLTQGTLKIEAEEVIISVKEGSLSTVSAKGEQASLYQLIKPESPPVQAKADSIFFDVAKDSLLLLGAAKVEHGESRFEGNRIEYLITDEVVTAQERVRMTIPTINSQ